ncbi:hypothetical protein P3T76_013901 [Phytophthora citrophthora]|uniref:Uncharacterized protein n=1 Tax=Phytophthora citrophthora TaxID=4793 RepID=A0AAD9LCR7_9STRA|nr:hypothetical protein P3T76_013901 [Phytophthora citrophthora]
MACAFQHFDKSQIQKGLRCSLEVRVLNVALAIDSLDPPEVPKRLDAWAELVLSEKLWYEDMLLRDSRSISRFRNNEDGIDCSDDGAGEESMTAEIVASRVGRAYSGFPDRLVFADFEPSGIRMT